MRDMQTIEPRPELIHVPYVLHGGHNSQLPTGELRDFSANINPYGPSPRIWQAMQAVPLAQHPDPQATPLRRALAVQEQVAFEQVIIGNGAADLIYQLAVAYLCPADRVMVVTPTFGEYDAAAQVMGAEVIPFPTYAENNFALDVGLLARQVQDSGARMLFLYNPNNPTGTYHKGDEIEYLLHACPDTLVVLDEAFVNFVAYPWASRDLLHYDNLLLLRSFTKDYALAGLGVSYALGHPDTIAALEKVQPPWTVNAVAQAATIAALDDVGHMQRTLSELAQASTDLRRELREIGLEPLPSAVHFFLLPVHSARWWKSMLLTQGILVRDCSSFGLAQHIRIAPQQPAANQHLIQALRACQQKACVLA